MLIRYAAENYRSLKDRQEISFVAGAYRDHPEFVARTEAIDAGLLRVAVIYGPNASGKSNVIFALRFIARAVQESFRDWDPAKEIPLPKFKLDRAGQQPSVFEVEFLLEGVRYKYGFIADEKTFTDEWLFAYPNRIKNLWFTRSKSGFRFGKALAGNKNSIKSLTRPNSLFLSAAAQNNHAQLLPIYQWFTNQLTFRLGPSNPTAVTSATAQMCSDKVMKSQILNYMRSADLGIVDLAVDKEESPEFDEIFTGLEKLIGAPLKKKPDFHRIKLAHAGVDGSMPVEFDVSEESRGTQAYFVLIGQALHALQSGSTLVIDELDSSLHPLLALEIVALFNNPSTNPRSAQLLFNTHDTNLLDNKYLRRDQVWFTEKDQSGQTHLYPLSDFKSRNDENLEKGYLQGRFGAIPFISNSAFNLLGHDGKESI